MVPSARAHGRSCFAENKNHLHRASRAAWVVAAMLFTAAKVAHLNRLPQGKPEWARRVKGMVDQMDAEAFGRCTNHYECMEACPKEIPVKFIAEMNRAYTKATLAAEKQSGDEAGYG